VLLKAATRFQVIRDDWENRAKDLDEALTYNRKIWTVLVSSVTRADNPLPHPIKQNVANLGLFIFNQTLSLMSGAKPEKLAILININRELAAGLRGMGVPDDTVAAA
jgi:flagellar biosynthesis activator protein FlaF